MTKNYKERITRYDSKMKVEVQTWKKRFEDAKAKQKADAAKFEEELRNLLRSLRRS